MDTTVIRVNLRDITAQFFQDLKAAAGDAAEVEIKLAASKHGEGLFSEEEFWQIIDLFDWKQTKRSDIVKPAILALSQMPIPSIYLFHDMLSENLYRLDTKKHADAYLQKQSGTGFSADDFLYVRCAVVAEGKAYYERVLGNPAEMPADIDFEHLLNVAGDAYELKTNREFDYFPLFNYETGSNTEGWQH